MSDLLAFDRSLASVGTLACRVVKLEVGSANVVFVVGVTSSEVAKLSCA